MEFYSYDSVDLLNNKQQVQIGEVGVRHSKYVEIAEIDDLTKVLQTIYKERTATATKMNVANPGHSGSSRSHAALILTLYQVLNDQFQKSQFHLVDLAGAERPDKAGGMRAGGTEVMNKIYAGKPLLIGDQGFIINFELS